MNDSKIKVFVDGHEGTTGLKIHERLIARDDIELIDIDPELRKDPTERMRCLTLADIAFLCLPDDASREAVRLGAQTSCRFIDASTAHRTHADWVYGLPELRPGQRDYIKYANKVAVPGCHASAFLLGIIPLREYGLITEQYPLVAYSMTGYTGGGKKLISRYEAAKNAGIADLDGSRHYALSLNHKHLAEMAYHARLQSPPAFLPVIANYPQGIVLTIPLHQELLNDQADRAHIHQIIKDYYKDQNAVTVSPLDDESALEDGYLNPCSCNETNRADIFVFGNNKNPVIAVRIDNLGKGASGAAIQCMNLMTGKDEFTSLKLYY